LHRQDGADYREGGEESGCIAVVSGPMSGVTNRLIEAAKKAQAGNKGEGAAVVDALRRQHEAALTSLIQREEERARIRQRMEEGARRRAAALRRNRASAELTPRALRRNFEPGERLSAPLLAEQSESWGC